MVNEEQIKILRWMVETWNKMRRENPDVRIDLSKADLSKAKLGGADLSKANLREAILCGADLSKSDLSGATLVEANLEGSILTGCKVYGSPHGV
jgi:uncharacterized protein YjbI with pentapeptide repeats